MSQKGGVMRGSAARAGWRRRPVLRAAVAVLLSAGLSACGGGATSSPPPVSTGRPTVAIAAFNVGRALAAGNALQPETAALTGQLVLTGGMQVSLTSPAPGDGRQRALLGDASLRVNFTSGTLTGSGSNFAETVLVAPAGADLTVLSYNQILNGSLTFTGTAGRMDGLNVLLANASGQLAGTLVINGTSVPGVYQLTATDNRLVMARSTGGALLALGARVDEANQRNLVSVTFRSDDGQQVVPICLDSNCVGDGGLSGLFLLR